MKPRPVVSASFLSILCLAAAPLLRADSPPPSPAAAAEQKDTLAAITPMSEDKRVKAEAIDEVMAEGKVFFLDVREAKEIEETGSYEGYVHIPMGQLEARLGELPKDRPILVAWRSGGRAARAAALLEKNGFQIAGFCGLKDYKGDKRVPARNDEKK